VIINPDLERWYYARAKSRTTEIRGASHSVYESHPKEVAVVIAAAARSREAPKGSEAPGKPATVN
jgi:pimeloyl-ACP methyl ester carboxylesterase